MYFSVEVEYKYRGPCSPSICFAVPVLYVSPFSLVLCFLLFFLFSFSFVLLQSFSLLSFFPLSFFPLVFFLPAGELGLRQFLESRGHELVVTADKDGDNCELDQHLKDAHYVISQPFYPAYITAERMANAPNLKAAITVSVH